MASSSAIASCTPDKPHQPRGFPFPKLEYGKTNVAKRSFQPSWFDKWPWLHYCEENDSVVCHISLLAKSEKKLLWSSNADTAFISRGFSNWKDATKKFPIHEGTICHKEACLKVIILPSTTPDIASSLSLQHQVECKERRQCFLKILSNVRFLARQGLPLRGHDDETESNFFQLLKLRGEDDPRIETWLKKKTDKYTSADIQNEILKLMAMRVLRELILPIQAAPFFCIMVDETTDAANKEQVVVCLRWVDDIFEAHEMFVGLYKVESTEASAILFVIRDVLKRFNISIAKLRGHYVGL